MDRVGVWLEVRSCVGSARAPTVLSGVQSSASTSGNPGRIAPVTIAVAALMFSPSSAAGEPRACAQQPSAIEIPRAEASPGLAPRAHDTPAGFVVRATPTDVNSAEARYAAAEDALAAGRPAEAQRTFERLVAEFPETPYADAARRKLIDLYGRPVVAETNLPGRAPPLAPQAPGADATATSRSGWQTEVMPARREPAAREDADIALATASLRAAASDRVFFAAGSAALGSRAHLVIAEQARWLIANQAASVVIEGHADDPGDALENRALGLARAQAVRAALESNGVDRHRIGVQSLGCEQPVASCADAVCGAQNRRAVTRIAGAARSSQGEGERPEIGPRSPGSPPANRQP